VEGAMKTQHRRRGKTIERDGLRITPHVLETRVAVAEAGHCYGFVHHAPFAVELEYQGKRYAFDMEGQPLTSEELPFERQSAR
jgi:hypothetical protein